MPITIRGNHFVKDGKRFVIHGVVYQPYRGSRFGSLNPEDFDPLLDDHIDEIHNDITLFRELGINAIHVYRIVPSLSHDAAFAALAAAGIHVTLGLSHPSAGKCINRLRPRESYTRELLDHYFETVDCASKYDNIIGVVAADHVINNPDTTLAAEVIRAVVRDVKIHMKQQHEKNGQRILPVGISDEYFAAKSTNSIDYFTAGNKDTSIDFYSFVKFDQVEESSVYWQEDVYRFEGKGLPVFVSEYGGNSRRPREFHEAKSLYSSDALRVLSGGFAYEFKEGPNKYGLIMSDGQRLQDFENLRRSLEEVKVPESELDDVNERCEILSHDFPPVSDSWRASSDIPASLVFDT